MTACRNATLCRALRGKTLRHRFTGQVRTVTIWGDNDKPVQFCQDRTWMPRSMFRTFRSAAKWLRNAEVIA